MDPVVSAIARYTLVAVFGLAAIHKLRDPLAFSGVVRGYRLLPDVLAPGVTVSLVALESTGVIALLWPGLAWVGALLIGGLLVLYSCAIGINLARGRRDVDCGCLGPGRRQPLSGWLLGRNALLGGAALVSAWPVTARSIGWIDFTSMLAAVAGLLLLGAAAMRLLPHDTAARSVR